MRLCGVVAPPDNGRKQDFGTVRGGIKLDFFPKFKDIAMERIWWETLATQESWCSKALDLVEV